MRIAMVGTKGIPAKWGGIEKYVEEIGKRLVQRGHEVTIFGSRWYIGDYRDKEYLGMRVRPMSSFHRQSTDALSNGLLSSFYSVKGRFDIVHLHGYASYYYIPLIKAFGKKTIITAHGVESGWQNPKYGPIARKIIELAFKIGINTADSVITVAEHLRAHIISLFGVDSLVVPSGITIESILKPSLIKEKYGLNGDDYILFLGRIDPIKRVDWVVELSNAIKSEFNVVIAGGPQDSASEAYYIKLKEKSGKSSKCIFTGPVSGQEKQELLSNCRLFISPSMNEGLPVALLEASSFGRPCLASNISAHKEIIENGHNGFLFEVGKKEEFINSTSRIIKLPKSELDLIGESAKNKVTGAFNWDRSTDLLETAYNRLLN